MLYPFMLCLCKAHLLVACAYEMCCIHKAAVPCQDYLKLVHFKDVDDSETDSSFRNYSDYVAPLRPLLKQGANSITFLSLIIVLNSSN